jgi:hypothetical protein
MISFSIRPWSPIMSPWSLVNTMIVSSVAPEPIERGEDAADAGIDRLDHP